MHANRHISEQQKSVLCNTVIIENEYIHFHRIAIANPSPDVIV